MRTTLEKINPEEYFGYKGYLVRLNTITGTFMINKDGAFIGWAPNASTARELINQLVD